jgi:hypothetical protein
MVDFQHLMDEPIHPVQIEALKRMTPEQKLRAVAEMWHFARAALAQQIRGKHPDWDDAAVDEEVKRRLIYGTS